MIITDINELRKKNFRVEDHEVFELISLLEKELFSSPVPGVGLAAPQIGIHKSIAIIRIKINGYEENYNLINPVIVEKNNGFINENEGCLSLPNIKINTNRHKEIFVKDKIYPAGFVLVGFSAVVAEHEIDHIENILIIDRISGKNKMKRNDPCPCGNMKNGKPVKWKNCHGRFE